MAKKRGQDARKQCCQVGLWARSRADQGLFLCSVGLPLNNSLFCFWMDFQGLPRAERAPVMAKPMWAPVGRDSRWQSLMMVKRRVLC